MNIKLSFLSALTLSFTLMSQIAHADFRKALDAYIARDGDKMLKEVKDAVEKKNDDGLMLLLMATNMDTATSDYDETTKQSKSTLIAILPQPKWDEMQNLLAQAANNSSIDAQYYLHASSQFRTKDLTKLANEYFLKGSRLATLSSTTANISDKAEAGDIQAQITTGFRYLGYSNFLCEKQIKDPACQGKDETKGFSWLRRAIVTNEASTQVDFDLLPSKMCKYYLSTANGDLGKLKQAYLWAIKGISDAGKLSDSNYCLNKVFGLNPNLKLKVISGESPQLLKEAKKSDESISAPNLSYTFNDDGITIEVDPDRKIYLRDNQLLSEARIYYKKLTSTELSSLKSDLEKLGVCTWTSAQTDPLMLGGKKLSKMQFLSKYSKCINRIQVKDISLGYMNFESSISNKNLSPEEVDATKRRVKSMSYQRMAKVKKLLEQYLPTQQFRCSLGRAESKINNCIMKDKFFTEISL